MTIKTIFSTLIIYSLLAFSNYAISKSDPENPVTDLRPIEVVVESEQREYTIFQYDFSHLNKKSINKKWGASSAFIDGTDDQIFILTPEGSIFYINKSELTERKNIKLFRIATNFHQLINFDNLNQGVEKTWFGTRDIKIIGNRIYVSFTKPIRPECFSISVVRAEINDKDLKFETAFDTDQCILTSEPGLLFDGSQSGGKIADFDEQNILLTIGDFGMGDLVKSQNPKQQIAQDPNSIFGKVLKINKHSGHFNIISMGHRSINGLFHDKTNHIILTTEHGPNGGDEVNVNNYKSSPDIKNFGWPIASDGKVYYFMYQDNNLTFKKHDSNNGFLPPVFGTVPSVGISELTCLSADSRAPTELEETCFVGTMGLNNFRSIIRLNFLPQYKKVKKLERIYLNDRVRDIMMLDQYIFFYGESSSTLNLLPLDK